MLKAGFVIAVIAGVIGVVIPSSLMMQGLSSSLLNWFGILCSLLVVVLGGAALRVKSWIPGVLLIVCAVSGAILGGFFVAIYLIWAVLGGMLALLGPMIFGSNKTLSS